MSSIKKPRAAFCILIGLLSGSLWAQTVTIGKWQPGLSFTHKFNQRWSANFTAGGLYALSAFDQEDPNIPGLERAEGKLFVTYKFFNSNSVSGGYMFRKYAPSQSASYEHRLTQQFVHIANAGPVRLSHRLRLEQRIFDNGFVGRLRYRFGGELPLRGAKIDAGEAYLLATEALVLAVEKEGSSLENRFTPGIGWQLTEEQKLEFRIQHRYRGALRSQALHLITNYYLNL